MVSVETVGKIRRAWHVHGKSIRSIAKSMGVSRNTVRKVLRSDVSAPQRPLAQHAEAVRRPCARTDIFSRGHFP